MMKRFTLLWLPLDIPSYNFDWQMSQGENSSRDEGMVPDSSSRSMWVCLKIGYIPNEIAI
jgi:hypothetical protein